MPAPSEPQPDKRPLLFGVASADHQCEAYDENLPDIRDLWERRRGQVLRGKATDFWNRYKEDIALAKSLGCRIFRFSLAWSKIEPVEGTFDPVALAHYSAIVDELRANGMEPLVTLLHNTWPIHVEERGGLIGDDFPKIFARYVEHVAAYFGDRVTYWVTINEPTQLVYGYVKPWWAPAYFMPPGLPRGATTDEQMSAVATLVPNLFRAHASARGAIKAVNPNARVGSNPLLLGLPLWLQKWVDFRATRLRSRERFVRAAASFTERAVLEQGSADVVLANMTPTAERETTLAFSETYFETDLAVAVASKGTFQRIDDLAAKTVGVVRSSTAESRFPRLLSAADSAVFARYDEALAALDAGSIDAVIGDRAILQSFSAREPGKLRLLDESLGPEPYAASTALGNRELLDAVDLAIRDFKESGSWAHSYARNFPDRPVPPPPARRDRATLASVSGKTLPGSSLERRLTKAVPVLEKIERRGYVTVAVKGDVPGFSARNPASGELEGFEIDLARAISRRIFGDPSRVRFKIVETQERSDALHSFGRFLLSLMKIVGTLTTFVNSNWWALGMAGKLPEFLCPAECVGRHDFVGFDYYWGVNSLRLKSIAQLVDAANGRYASAPVWPGVLYDLLKFHGKLFPGKEIIVVENGCVDLADNVARADYIERHVAEIVRARNEGVNVAAYLCWSITSNREWGYRFDGNSDFGLYHIDLDTDPALTRRWTPAVDRYKNLIANFPG